MSEQEQEQVPAAAAATGSMALVRVVIVVDRESTPHDPAAAHWRAWFAEPNVPAYSGYGLTVHAACSELLGVLADAALVGITNVQRAEQQEHGPEQEQVPAEEPRT